MLVVAMGGKFLTSTATISPILAPDGGPLVSYMVAMPRVLVAVGVLVGLLRSTLVRSAVAQSVLELGALPTPDRLEQALRQRLADPNLHVVRWSRAAAAFQYRDGRTVVMPADRARTLTILSATASRRPPCSMTPLSSIYPVFLTTMTEAVRLALDTTDLRDELRSRGGDAGGLPRGEVTFLFGDIEDSADSSGGYARAVRRSPRCESFAALSARSACVRAVGWSTPAVTRSSRFLRRLEALWRPLWSSSVA